MRKKAENHARSDSGCCCAFDCNEFCPGARVDPICTVSDSISDHRV